ncbi:membrane protein [Legionella norrlandica]|uniref:Membrane protein n=1 Tax=Legionella norrlandica TaxID=1498499 RepID=A0A0A2SVM1_9GAMM|nr:LegC2/C7 family Dot/Icm T4SS effector [Legionella norrlandica]KGP63454.1 membrane protein [Legionella norrlandica]
MATNETELKVLIKADNSVTTTNGTESTLKSSKDSTDAPEIETDSLKKIIHTQKQLSDVKESLGSIVDSMAENPSLFTRAATAWGELPMWQKVTGGVVLTAPTLAVGLFAHIGVLLVIGGVTGITYTAGAIVLDDHHTCNVNIAKRLKEGLFGLADVLQITIDALDEIRKKFAEEIQKFKKENTRLTENIDRLDSQVESLTTQVELFMETEKLLRKFKNDLEETTRQLQESASKQTDLLERNQKELSQVVKEYERSQKQLATKVAELHEVRTSLGLEVEKAKIVANTLQGAVQTLSGTVIADQEKRASFQKQLDGFLNAKEISFDQVAERICQAEEELRMVQEELRRSNERYNELLKRHEAQVDRLDKMVDRAVEIGQVAESDKENIKLGNDNLGLYRYGLYCNEKKIPAVSIPDDTHTVREGMRVH